MFYDGGSTEYKYPNYTVLKLNALQYDTQTTDKDLGLVFLLDQYNKVHIECTN